MLTNLIPAWIAFSRIEPPDRNRPIYRFLTSSLIVLSPGTPIPSLSSLYAFPMPISPPDHRFTRQADPHTLSHAQNVKQATHKVNQFAKRDPALFPLSIIMCLALGGAGYFL